MQIIVIGSINKDIVFFVKQIAKPGETIHALSQNTFLGGKGYNQALAISKSFEDISFYGSISVFATFISDKIVKEIQGAQIKHVPSPTGTAFIQVDQKGENSIVVSGNANTCMDINDIYLYLSQFHKGDIVVLQNEINDIPLIIDYCKKHQLKTILNPSPFTNEITKELIQQVDMIICNQHELLSILQKDTIEESIFYIKEQAPNQEWLITFGDQGAMFIKEKKEYKTHAIAVDVIDTTCAGDTFLGYFVSHYAKGYEIDRCLTIAAKAASICISRKGASSSIPELFEVIK